jgi:hypothetical protein
MNIMKLAAAAAVALSAMTVAAAPAAAQRDGWRDQYGRWHDGYRDRWRDDDGYRDGRYYRTNGNHYGWRNHPRHRDCRWVWRYHHRERICRWVRW